MQAGNDFLCERAAMVRNTSYTEMSTTLARRAGVREFDFSQQAERAGMGYLLRRIGEDTLPNRRCDASRDRALPGFEQCAPGILRAYRADGAFGKGCLEAGQERFWVDQVARVFRHFEGKSSRG